MDSDYYFCLFHYARAIYRRLSVLGFTSKYKRDPSFIKTIKKFFSLPFFSLDRIISAYESIEAELLAYDDPKVLEFLECYKKPYFGTNLMTSIKRNLQSPKLELLRKNYFEYTKDNK